MAGAGAALAGLYFGAALPGSLMGRGYPIAAWTMVAVTVPFVAFLAAMALFPGPLQRVLERSTRLDLTDAGHGAAAIVMAATLFFVLGYGALVNGAYAYESEVVRHDEPTPIDGNALFVGLTLNLIVLILPPLFYLGFVGAGSEGGPIRALGLRAEGAPRALAWGAGSAVVVVLLIALASAAISGLDVELPDNTRALEIARSITVLGAIGLAVGSAVSEEIFFRGFLQPRVGYWGQAILFSLAHLSYVNVLEVVVTFALALLFGALYKRTGSLLAPIAGHFTFNLLMLLAGIFAPQNA